MVSMNQFNNARFDFYEEEIEFFRQLISPIADVALDFYQYKLESLYFDKNGDKIAKINVIPKSEFRPCMFGWLYVNTSYNAIHSLDLNITGAALKQPILDTVNVKQVHVNLGSKNQFALLTQTAKFNAKGFGFKMYGNFLGVFSNYNLNRSDVSVAELKNKNEIFKADKDAIKNDSLYWSSQRPVPLSEEESNDYIKKDSLQRLWKSEAYLDSIDARGNKFKIAHIFFGYSHDNSYENKYWGIQPLLSAVSFNAVEGLNVSIKPFYRSYTKDESKRLNINGEFRYGFSDKSLKTYVNTSYRYDRIHLASVGFGIGRNLNQYDHRGVILPLFNTLQSLFGKKHFAQVYGNDFISGFWTKEVSNGLIIRTTASHTRRFSVENTTNYSFFKKNNEYESNIPNGIDATTLNNHKSSVNVSLRWTPNQKYMSYPNYRNRFGSNVPVFNLSIERAFPIKNNGADFTKMRLGMNVNELKMGVFGFSSLNTEYGRFLTKKNINFIDQFHYLGSEIVPYIQSNFSTTFFGQDYYNLSSDQSYFIASYQHNFQGWMTDKIPLLNKLGVGTILSFKTIQRKDLHYYEAGFGIDGIKIGIINIGRLDYIASFDTSGFLGGNVRIGLAAIIEQVIE
jgi:hypothetical protein